jgi:hypothetical protein
MSTLNSYSESEIDFGETTKIYQPITLFIAIFNNIGVTLKCHCENILTVVHNKFYNFLKNLCKIYVK